jgi:hypothetical protein
MKIAEMELRVSLKQACELGHGPRQDRHGVGVEGQQEGGCAVQSLSEDCKDLLAWCMPMHTPQLPHSPLLDASPFPL